MENNKSIWPLIKEIFTKTQKTQLITFLVLSNIFLSLLYYSKADTRYIIFEETSLGYIPMNILKKDYDLEDELKSFVKVYLFKRYNFTPENVKVQINDSFKLSSKRVADMITKNMQDKGIIEQVERGRLSQIYTSDEIKYSRQRNLLEAISIGERIIAHDSKIESRDRIKLSFLIRIKDRDPINPYKFYIDGVREEVIK